MKKNKYPPIINLAILVFIILIFFSINNMKLDENQEEIQNIDFQIIEEGNMKIISGFTRPFGLTLDSEDKMYITDFGGHSMLIYDKNLNLVKNVNPQNEAILKNPHSVDFDSEDKMYITDFGNKKVQKFSKQGNFISTFVGEDYLKGPATSYFDKDKNLYVSDYGSNALMKFSKQGRFIGWIGAKEDGTLTNEWESELIPTSVSNLPGGFDRLHMANIGSDGSIYVADTWNNRIQKFSSNGRFIGWIGAKEDGSLTYGWEKEGIAVSSSLPGAFNTPVSLDIAENGDLIILEFNGNRVQRFSEEGIFIEILATGFNQGYDAKIKENKLYVVDTGNNQIKIITLF